MQNIQYQITGSDGKSYQFGEEGISIGRGSSNQIVLHDRTVSRLHAQIRVAAGRLWIRDYENHIGTFVNGQRVPGQMEVKPGETIQIGDTSFQIWQSTPIGQDTRSPLNKRQKNLVYVFVGGAAIVLLMLAIGLSSGNNPPANPPGGNTIPNSNNSILPGTTIQDDEPPTIVIESPTTVNTFSTIDGEISISGTAFDKQGLSKIEWSLAGNPQGTTGGLESWSIQNAALSSGDNLIQVTAYDQAGNSFSDEIMVTRNNFFVFGMPEIDPAGIQVNQSVDVIIRVRVSTSQGLSQDSVRLQQLDGQYNLIQQMNTLWDDGDLVHGDDIKGDNVFSTIQNFQVSSPGALNFRIAASSASGSGDDHSPIFSLNVFTPLTDQEFNEVITTQTEAVQVLNDNTSTKDLDEALNATVTWLKGLPQVSNVTRIGTDIEIQYKSGIGGGLWVSELDANNQVINQGSLPATNLSSPGITPLRANQPAAGAPGQTGQAGSNQNIVLDKDVYLYSPFETIFTSTFKDSMENLLNQSDIKFNVSSCEDQQCTIAVLDSLTNYGLVILYTHGTGGEHILTGELVDQTNKNTYADLIKQGNISIWTNITYNKDLWLFDKQADIYSVTSAYISSLTGTFPNSIIYNGSCDSTKTNNLSNAFINKGAKTYFGFGDIVHTTFDVSMAEDLIKKLVVDLKSTGESFTTGQIDPTSPFAKFEMVGSADMKFSLGLINGDFEYGDLTAWSTDGDGRVISQLGSQTPPQGSYMGIISTGLGFTTSKGSISQSFRVSPGETNLSLKWNFLSEEFMEYVGSKYQDTFKISILDANGNEKVILEKSIDQFASEYNLVSVSPEIIFDQGDVYMTGWQTLTYDLSAYSGQNITLILSAGDVGDSIFDSAILLDEIYLY